MSIDFYDIPIKDIPAWSLAISERGEAREIWGVLGNINLENIKLAGINHLYYTILIPGLMSTRDSHIFEAMNQLPLGEWIIIFYTFFLLLIVGNSIFVFIKNIKHGLMTESIVILLGYIWLISRIIFYTWWDPYDPFLFAVMSIPVLWLFLLIFLNKGKLSTLRLVLALVMVILVWSHNYLHIINPLNASILL